MFRLTSSLVLVVASVASLSAQTPAVFHGEDGNWFNPRNWSTGQVPGPDTDVMIPAGAAAVIDPTLTAGPVLVRDLYVAGGTLTTRPGTQFGKRYEFVTNGGRVLLQSTETVGDLLYFGGANANGTEPGIRLNPTSQSIRTVILKSSVHVEFGLGGTIAAGPGQTGRGRYATMTADWGLLAGNLKVNLHYGFVPQAGDSFTLIRSNGLLLGTFDHLPEGSLVERFGDVGLFISYCGGRGSDVVLTARTMR